MVNNYNLFGKVKRKNSYFPFFFVDLTNHFIELPFNLMEDFHTQPLINLLVLNTGRFSSYG